VLGGLREGRRHRQLGRRDVSAYYNEIDPFAAEWLRRLIAIVPELAATFLEAWMDTN